MYLLNMLFRQPLRFALTVGGISLCIILMLFLLGIYRGVADGSVAYIRENKADYWVLQKNCTNILRGSSFLSSVNGDMIKSDPNVAMVSPVLLLLSTIKKDNHASTIFLAGYNPSLKLGGPPKIIEGRNINQNNEIVLDYSFAAKNEFKVADKLVIQDDTLIVVGISSGTNAFVIQYAFTTLEEARSLVGFPNLVTCFLVKAKYGKGSTAAADLQKLSQYIVVYDHQTFLNNNIKEMESGFLPILFAVAAISAIVLTTILSLILSINILEKKKDFAVMKILGAPGYFLPFIVIKQSLLISIIAFTTAIILFFPLIQLIERVSPEVSAKSDLFQIAVVLCVTIFISLISSLISINRLRKIYPLEVFDGK